MGNARDFFFSRGIHAGEKFSRRSLYCQRKLAEMPVIYSLTQGGRDGRIES
jgi:hypothetical protein